MEERIRDQGERELERVDTETHAIFWAVLEKR